MDTDVRFPTPTTRRTIVRTGVKLAYAAPLVAASFKVSAMNVAAATSPPHFVCTGPFGPCLNVGPGPDCSCATAVPSGAFVCVFDFPCFDFLCDAVTGAGCPAGALCVVDAEDDVAHCRGPCGVPCPCRPKGTPCFTDQHCCSGTCAEIPGSVEARCT